MFHRGTHQWSGLGLMLASGTEVINLPVSVPHYTGRLVPHLAIGAAQDVATEFSASADTYEFLRYVKANVPDDFESAAIGVFDGVIYVWVFTRKLDVAVTKRIFDLREMIGASSSFEIHVEPLQGRDLLALIPNGFNQILVSV
jgi:hypothetical protein